MRAFSFTFCAVVASLTFSICMLSFILLSSYILMPSVAPSVSYTTYNPSCPFWSMWGEWPAGRFHPAREFPPLSTPSYLTPKLIAGLGLALTLLLALFSSCPVINFTASLCTLGRPLLVAMPPPRLCGTPGIAHPVLWGLCDQDLSSAAPELSPEESLALELLTNHSLRLGTTPYVLLACLLSDDCPHLANKMGHNTVAELRTPILTAVCKHAGDNPSLLEPFNCRVADSSDSQDPPPTPQATQAPSLGAQSDSATAHAADPTNYLPIMLLPGLSASRLTATWNKTTVPSAKCPKVEHTWTNVWLTLENLLKSECWADTLALGFDAAAGLFTPRSGINVLPTSGLPGVEYLVRVSPHIKFEPYMASLVQYLKANVSYTDLMMDAIPYDWRQSAAYLNEQYGLFQTLKIRIEALYTANGNTSVAILAHSLGCDVATAFLNAMPLEWRTLYVAKFLAVAPPLLGAPGSAFNLLTGNDSPFMIGPLSLIKPKHFLSITRTWPGLAQVFPVPGSAPPDGQGSPLIQSPSRNYSVQDLPELFRSGGFPDTATMIETTASWLSDLEPPEVPVECIYGHGTQTPVGLVYDSDDIFNTDPTERYADGDGIVPLASLTQCALWGEYQSYSVHEHVIDGVNHSTIITNTKTLELVKTLLVGE